MGGFINTNLRSRGLASARKCVVLPAASTDKRAVSLAFPLEFAKVSSGSGFLMTGLRQQNYGEKCGSGGGGGAAGVESVGGTGGVRVMRAVVIICPPPLIVIIPVMTPSA